MKVSIFTSISECSKTGRIRSYSTEENKTEEDTLISPLLYRQSELNVVYIKGKTESEEGSYKHK